MHVAVIGATGRVGSRLVTELLSRGHTVTGLALHPLADASCAGLMFAAIDATDPAALAPALKGNGAVLSAMRFVSSGAHVLVNAVKTAGVPRLLVVGGTGSLAPGKMLLTTAGWLAPEAISSMEAGGSAFLRSDRDVEAVNRALQHFGSSSMSRMKWVPVSG